MRKIFKHMLVPEVEMTTEEFEGKRHYVLSDGRKFPSVTSVLGEKLDKSGLEAWRKRVGDAEADRISIQAARRGTAIHNIAEKYVLNEDRYTNGAMPVNVHTFQQIKRFLDKHVDNILGIELPLYSIELNTAGRTDLVAEFDGVASIVDFKTSRKPKKEEWIESYFLQTTTYAMMFEAIYCIKIPQIAILIAVDDEEGQLFVKDKKQFEPRVREIFS